MHDKSRVLHFCSHRFSTARRETSFVFKFLVHEIRHGHKLGSSSMVVDQDYKVDVETS